MRIHYTCDVCGDAIDSIELPELDEAKLGFDRLTEDDRRELVRYADDGETMYVQSLCDRCIQVLGLESPAGPDRSGGLLH